MLVCNVCDEGYHQKCLQPPLELVSESLDWICSYCKTPDHLSPTGISGAADSDGDVIEIEDSSSSEDDTGIKMLEPEAVAVEVLPCPGLALYIEIGSILCAELRHIIGSRKGTAELPGRRRK